MAKYRARITNYRIPTTLKSLVIFCLCVTITAFTFLTNTIVLFDRCHGKVDTLQVAETDFLYAVARTIPEAVRTTKSVPTTFPPIQPTDTNSTIPSIQQMFAPRKVSSTVTIPYSRHPSPSDIISNKAICRNTNVDILIYVQSFWRNFDERRAMRASWVNTRVFHDIAVRTVFVLGRPGPDESGQQLLINNEYLVYGDIVQGDFVDSLKSVTLNSQVMLRWVYENCRHARYVIKADDDMFVNIFLMVERLVSSIWTQEKVVVCHVKGNGTTPIIRRPSSNWYVPSHVFPNSRYFPFTSCAGYVVLFTGDLIVPLYLASFEAPYIAMDDVYIFGLLMSSISDVQFVDVQQNFTLNQNLAMDEYTGNGSYPLTHIAASAWAEDSMTMFWMATIDKLSTWAKQHASVIQVKNARIASVEESGAR
jgi:hypothetical protein